MCEVVVQGRLDVVGKEMLVRHVAAVKVLSVVWRRRVVEVARYVNMARDTA